MALRFGSEMFEWRQEGIIYLILLKMTLDKWKVFMKWKLAYLQLVPSPTSLVPWVAYENNTQLKISFLAEENLSAQQGVKREVWLSLSHVRMLLQPAAGSWAGSWNLFSHGSGVLAGWLVGCSSLSTVGAVEGSPALVALCCDNIDPKHSVILWSLLPVSSLAP